jgi:beta-phosphoglucomutase-like phosphatase (HAD superfamily)
MSMRWIMQGWAVLAALELVSSYHIAPFIPGSVTLRQFLIKTDSRPSSHFRDETRRRRLQAPCRYTVRWSSFGDDTEDDDEGNDKESAPADSLFEFLNRRQGVRVKQEESERRRKRNRIKDWMNANASRRSSHPMVQPIRMEDGSVMESPDPPKTKTNLESLLSGMPSLGEILSKGGESESSKPSGQQLVDADPGSVGKTKQVRNDSWFDGEKVKLEQDNQKMLEEMRSELSEQRRQEPDSVPGNAEGILESVMNQDMKKRLSSAKNARAEERLQGYEIKKNADLDSRDLTDATDAVVEQIMKETAKDWERRVVLQAEVDDFIQYERELFQGSALIETQIIPEPGSNLDEWALERLEYMLSSTQQDDSDGMISDILEQNIEDLRERIEKESKEGSIQPKTMKEWQMYRSIATRLKKQKSANAGEEVDEEGIATKLESWKQYVAKEEGTRIQSGLARGPRMPFEWQEAGRDRLQALETSKPSNIDTRSRREIRREVNIKAIEAMEDLVKRSDKKRGDSLKKALEELKAELEPRDYNDIEEEEEDIQKVGPVDISDVFGPRRDYEEEEVPEPLVLVTAFSDVESGGADNKSLNPRTTPFFSGFEEQTTQPQTPFFSDMSEDLKPKQTPRSPFFSGVNESDTIPESVTSGTSKLGSGDEQKLRSMYRRAGAETTEEKKVIRERWETFQKQEEESRRLSGLSDGDDSGLFDRADMKYNISDVMNADGDIDAKKILSMIGPRPVRRKSGTSSSLASASSQPDSKARSPEGTEPIVALESSIDPVEVADELYRSVSAVGGGRTKSDPSARAKEKSEFEEYLKKENELRQSLDELDAVAAELVVSMDGSVNDETYAEDAISSLGPRPVLRRGRNEVLNERGYSDRGGVLASDDDSQEEDDSSSDDPSDDVPPQVGLGPEWLRKERDQIKKKNKDSGVSGKFKGSDIDEVFDDDEYDKNMRQLAEYERRRSGEKRQMGIDITDVLGRNAIGSDDYSDYNYDDSYFKGRSDAWGAASFEARKANLLDYTELSTMELNNLIDFRDSVISTGVSPYLKRINKPFKEFGAIFRLEGVLIDITGLHQRAWKKVSTEFGFKEPMLEDVRLAAVTRADIAAREIFFWTDDILMCKEAANAHQKAMRELFDEWAQEMGISPPPALESKAEGTAGSMALGAESLAGEKATPQRMVVAPFAPTNEKERVELLCRIWSTTAETFGFHPPSMEQVVQFSVLSPDIAVRNGFRWSSDPAEIDKIVSTYRQIMQESLSGQPGIAVSEAKGISKTTAAASSSSPETGPPPSVSIDEATMLELQFIAWAKLAEENGLDSPLPEEVLAAAVLNDPEMVITNGFGWTEDFSRAHELASRYRALLVENFNDRIHGRSFQSPPPAQDKPVTPEQSQPEQKGGPTAEEFLEMQNNAWKEAATTHNFQPPSPDQMQLTMNMDADEAVRRLLALTHNFSDEQIKAISVTYEEARKRASQKYIAKYKLKAEPADARSTAKTVEYAGPSTEEIFKVAYDAWVEVALKRGFALPDNDQVVFAMSVGPEAAIVSGFGWAKDQKGAEIIAKDYRQQLAPKRAKWQSRSYISSSVVNEPEEESLPLVVPISGTTAWVKSLVDVEMECGVLSYLDRDQVDMLLEYAGLATLIPRDRRVSAGNGYGRDSQQMMGVALRLGRRPDHCVVFDSSPYASTAAHEVEMRSVSIVGPYPRYELLSADTSAISFDELTAMNIRRLFGERVYDQPMLELQQAPEMKKKVKVKTQTLFSDDD